MGLYNMLDACPTASKRFHSVFYEPFLRSIQHERFPLDILCVTSEFVDCLWHGGARIPLFLHLRVLRGHLPLASLGYASQSAKCNLTPILMIFRRDGLPLREAPCGLPKAEEARVLNPTQ
jgi:hypothetical protein